MSNYLLHDETVYQKKTSDLLDYWEPVNELPTKRPSVTWKGDPISCELMKQAVAFCRWSSKKFDGEGLLWLFYNAEAPKGERWNMWAPPQITSGLSVKSDPQDPKFDKQRKNIKGIHFGTIHDHHNIGASQSSVDEDDEAELEGIHITLGNTNDAMLTLHVRVNVAQHLEHMFEYREWFALPDWYYNVPDTVEDPESEILKIAIKNSFATFNPKKPEDFFPKQWRGNISKQKPAQKDFFLENVRTDLDEISVVPLRIDDITPREVAYIKKLKQFMDSPPAGDYIAKQYVVDMVVEDNKIGALELSSMGYSEDEVKIAEAFKIFNESNPVPYPKSYTASDYLDLLFDCEHRLEANGS